MHKLQSRIAFAYRKAAEVAKHKGENYKRYYVAAVRENKLEVGDRVLVRAVDFQGKHKIADRWDEEPYKVSRQPIPDIPVFEVQKKDGTEGLSLFIGISYFQLQVCPCWSCTRLKKPAEKRVTRGHLVFQLRN